MLSWFRALMPREERFFELFTRHAQVTVAGAVALRALLTGSKDVAQCCEEISQHEAEADELTREVLTALRRTFITPLDRGDIKDLITSMDDAIDQMNQTAKVITLFELRAFERPMMATQSHHAKLWLAGNARNWELAEYQVDELKEGLEDAAKHIPDYKGVPVGSMIESLMAITTLLGLTSCSISSRFGSNVVVKKLTPVTLPPGRLRLATSPL